jgi:plasmid stability protein
MAARPKEHLTGVKPVITLIAFFCFVTAMASITIRNLPEPTKRKLRVRAAESGASLESYVRDILNRVSSEPSAAPDNLAAVAAKHFGRTHGVDLILPPRGAGRPPVDFAQDQ